MREKHPLVMVPDGQSLEDFVAEKQAAAAATAAASDSNSADIPTISAGESVLKLARQLAPGGLVGSEGDGVVWALQAHRNPLESLPAAAQERIRRGGKVLSVSTASLTVTGEESAGTFPVRFLFCPVGVVVSLL